ncbi:MAG TPA: hypothetical protein VMG59_08260 [Phycisphaerae bacterium]|nr:hypothetical protein [Phycisphaerae bacterium]
MIKVAIGPEVNAPSWNWVGFDTLRELSKYFNVEAFSHEPPECDLVIYVKQPPKNFPATSSTKILYLPIDYFENPESIQASAGFLKSCAAIGCHCERLMPHMQPYCKDVFFIEHHGKYTLPQINQFKRDGYVLWIGSMEYVVYLLKWLQIHPVGPELRLATNYLSRSGTQKCLALAEKLDLKINISDTHINEYRLIYWSERSQFRAMREAKAALDIKAGPWLLESNAVSLEKSPANRPRTDSDVFHDDIQNRIWCQQLKPPTKAQKFVASGIPFAMNQDSYSFEHLKKNGFTLSPPQDQQWWFSEEYWRLTAAHAAELRRLTSLEYIGLQFKAVIERTVQQSPDVVPDISEAVSKP